LRVLDGELVYRVVPVEAEEVSDLLTFEVDDTAELAGVHRERSPSTRRNDLVGDDVVRIESR
jgi:hypothetical protein